MKLEVQQLALLSTLVIIFYAIIPLPDTSGGGGMDMAAHAIAYILSSFLWARSVNTKRYIALMTVLVPLTEILQLPLQYRNSNIADLVSNSVGTIIGYSIACHRC